MTSHALSYNPVEPFSSAPHALRLAAIADNLNNVLTVISAHSTLIQASVPKGDPQEANLDGINDAVRCAAALTRRLLLIADQGEP